ncbi:MAG: hypothetical protein LYZ69_08160 [Nitrososphaerales archaeon]|nr:hypothetical protein [Nitrososphaerales archaeon]
MPKHASRRRAEAIANRRVMEYLLKRGADLGFTNFFWKNCEPNEYEIKRFSRYAKVLLLASEGATRRATALEAGVGEWSVESWARFRHRPKLAHYLKSFLELGRPKKGWVWLSINNTPGHAVPLDPFIQVPRVIGDWKDVQFVLGQLQPIGTPREEASSPYGFGFLLGVMIGDAAKKRQAEWHRHLELVLSKRYDTSVMIGDFTSECARGIGVRMERVSDRAPYGNKPRGFYVWRSQSTALVDWLYNVCLGLTDDELTTYDSVRMDWALRAPKGFRRGLVQGLAESDGSVSIASQTVEFWIGPNWDFVKRLLLTFGVSSFRNREALSVARRQVVNLYTIPAFSPLLRTARYERFVKLANAAHIQRGKRIPVEIRERISEARRGGLSIPKISERILDEFGIILTFEAVQRWSSRVRTEPERGASESLQA